ncbi:putative ABC transporter permease [Lachnospiraceae bacterium ZAX-1]
MKKNFLICGLTGWCMEILFTAFDSFRKRELTLTGKTSIWMFPIYGMAAALKPIHHILKGKSMLFRSGIYTVLIFTCEFISGTFLKKHNLCPWDYSKAKANVNGVIRLDYAPFWMVAGLIFERILARSNETTWYPKRTKVPTWQKSK